jgi:hypothetical protein
MKIDINHPSFLNFINNVISNITTNVHIDKYFNLTHEQKLVEQLKVFKIMGSSLKNGVRLSELEYKSYVTVVLKISEENEKYELSAILKDISENFSGMYEITKSIKKPTTRKIKTNNKSE